MEQPFYSHLHFLIDMTSCFNPDNQYLNMLGLEKSEILNVYVTYIERAIRESGLIYENIFSFVLFSNI